MLTNMSTKISELKVCQIKEELSKRGIKSYGRKCDLVTKLKQQLNSSFIERNVHSSLEDDNNCDIDVVHQNTSSVNISAISSAATISDKNIPRITKKRTPVRKNSCFKVLNYIKELENKIKNLEVRLSKFIKSNNKKKSARNVNKNTSDVNVHQTKTAKTNNNNITQKKEPKNIIKPTLQRSDRQDGNDKCKILLLADSQGRSCAHILNKLLPKYKYDVTVFFYPNACFYNVTSNIEKLTKDFTFNDHVVLMAGTNDILKNTLISEQIVKNTLHKLSHTNVMIIGTLFWQNKSHFNYNVFLQNSLLDHISTNYNNVLFSDPNILVQYSDMSSHGLHLNKKGKFKIMSRIAKFIDKNISSDKIKNNNPVHGKSISTDAIHDLKIPKIISPISNINKKITVSLHDKVVINDSSNVSISNNDKSSPPTEPNVSNTADNIFLGTATFQKINQLPDQSIIP